MLPAHFYNVSYSQIWTKILQELIKSNIQEQSSNTEEQTPHAVLLSSQVVRGCSKV